MPDYGCVMLDLELVTAAPVIPEKWLHVDPEDPWTDIAASGHHATLKYGLLPDLVTQNDVDRAMDGWVSGTVLRCDFVEVFENEAYDVIVARPSFEESYALRDANARLSGLPHVDTYPVYKPHVTLAYVHSGKAEECLSMLHHHGDHRGSYYTLSAPLEFRVLGLSYS